MILESSKIILVNMVEFLIMSAKLAVLGLLKIKVCWNKNYDIITLVCDVTNKVLPHDSNYIVDLVMWPKSGNTSISLKEVIITSILYRFDQKSQVFWRVLLLEVQ